MRNYLLILSVIVISMVWATGALAAPKVFGPNEMYRSHYTPEERANLEVAEDLFTAFATEDMELFFGVMAEDIVWEINGSPDLISSHGAYHGKAAVQGWLEALAAEVEFLDFGTDAFFVDGNTVFVLFHDSGIARATGKLIEQRELAMITVEDGKIAHFLCFDDSAQELWAFTPDDDSAEAEIVMGDDELMGSDGDDTIHGDR